jgi:hypothetical protein
VIGREASVSKFMLKLCDLGTKKVDAKHWMRISRVMSPILLEQTRKPKKPEWKKIHYGR